LRTRLSPDFVPTVGGVAGLTLVGCAPRGAPSFSLFGAFFPAWMLCAFVGIAAAVVTRIVLGTFRSGGAVAHPLLFCSTVGVISAALLWLVWFGR